MLPLSRSLLLLRPLKRVLIIALLTAVSAAAQEESPSRPPVDAALLAVSPDEQSMIEHACSQARYIEGLAAFRACINRMIAELAQAPPLADLSSLSVDEQTMIEHACTQERYAQGPAAYRRCRASQLAALQKSPGEHDLSALSADEQAMLDHACSQERYVQGPAAYRACVGRQMAALAKAPAVPDLGQLPADERSMLDRACGHERYLQGPAAYRNCVRRQLAEMAAALAATGGSAAGAAHESPAAPESTLTHPLEEASSPATGEETPASAAPAEPAPESSWAGALVVLMLLACVALLAVFIRRQALFPTSRCPSCRRPTVDPGRPCRACEMRVDARRGARMQRPAADVEGRAEARPPAEDDSSSVDVRRAKSFSIEELRRMDQPAFEGLVVGLFRESGYSVLGPEDDSDAVGFMVSVNGEKDLVLCGQRNSELSLSTLCGFYISMMRSGASHGFVLTTTSFQHSAHAFARERAISLIDGAGLLEWVSGRLPKHVRAGHKSPPAGDDPHAILGISRSATQEQIRQAYLALLKKYHPDRVAHLGEEFRVMAEQRTRAINRAYEILLDNS